MTRPSASVQDSRLRFLQDKKQVSVFNTRLSQPDKNRKITFDGSPCGIVLPVNVIGEKLNLAVKNVPSTVDFGKVLPVPTAPPIHSLRLPIPALMCSRLRNPLFCLLIHQARPSRLPSMSALIPRFRFTMRPWLTAITHKRSAFLRQVHAGI